MRRMRAFRWMAAASLRKMTAVIDKKTTKAPKVEKKYYFDRAFSSGVFLCCLNVISVSTFSFAAPNCVLTKELLTDGLKVLISKEDELLYAARVHSLEIPDM